MNPETLLNRSGFDFYFLVVEPFLGIDLPEIKNFHSLFLPNLKVKNSGYLLSESSIKKIIQTSSKPLIIPFKPSAKIERICQKHGWKLAANPAKINRLLEDKVKFYELCQKHGLPLIDSLLAPFNQINFQIAQKKFGKNLVLQSHFGWAGNSTHHFSNFSQAEKFITSGQIVKFSPYLPGFTVLNNACLTRFGLIQSPPALQITGLKPLTQNPFATVGRQWPSLLKTSQINRVKKITQDFTDKILKPLDYRGFFGLDFFVAGDKTYLLECNPRLTASFAFYTHLEKRAKLTPLFYYHLLEFAQFDYHLNAATHQNEIDRAHIIGSELTQRSPSGTTIKKMNYFVPVVKSVSPLKVSDSVLKDFTS